MVVTPGDQAHSWAGLPVTMPRNTESGSSDTGVVTRSSASLIKGNVIKHLHLTVPCSVKLDRLRQSSKKLVLKNGSGYYTLTRAESLSYRIEGIKVLRTRNRSMPTATQKRGKKMNRPDPRGKGFHHYSQSRESGFLETSPGDYHKQGRFNARYSGPFRSRGRDNRFEQRRHWSPQGNYATRGRRDSYGRDYNNSGGPFGRRASSYPDESIGERRVTSPDGRYERVPRGDRDVSSGFQDRPGRYPDQRGEKRRHQSGSSIPETKKSLISTYRKTDVSCVQSNHTKSLNTSQNEDSKQLKKEPKENVVNNERTIQNHTLNKDKSGSSATSQGLSNSDSGKATQRTPSETIKPIADKHKKKGVLTMSQQIESLRSKHSKANVVEIKEITTQKSDDVNVTSRTGNGGNAKGSPHRTEISVPNHIDSEKSSGKVTEASSSGETESAAASPRRVHSARKSAPTSSVSRMQKSDMLKKQALLRLKSSQSPPASTTTSTPTARMGLGDMKPCQRDTDQGGPLKMEGGKGAFEHTDDNSSRGKEAFTPPRCEDIVVLSDTEDSVVDASSQDKGPTEESTGINRTAPQPSSDGFSSEGNQTTSSELDSNVDDKASTERSVPEVTSSGEVALPNSQRPEQGVEDQEMASDEGAAISETVTSENQGTVKCDDPEKSPDVGKIKEKALLKIKENLKKNLTKGKISPQTSSPGSRPDSRSSSNGSPENSVDTAEVTSVIDQPNPNKKDNDETSMANSALTENADTENHLPSGMPDCVPQVNGKEVCEEDIAKPSEPCPGDNKVANCIVIDMVDDIQQTSKSDDLHHGETQTSQGSTEPVADDSVHICNSLLDDPAKITSAPEKPDNVSSEMVQKPSALPEQSDEVSKNDDSSLPKFAGSFGNVEDLSDGSVDLGPHEPGDMDSIDDDLLLEDEPVIISEGYNPEPEKMDTSEIPESLDSEISELAIARVESQSEDVLHQVDSDQPSTVKRTLTEDGEDAVEEPACKKSRTETTDIIEGIESGNPEETADPDASKKPVIFTHNEWKEFAQSIKEKYEKLVQTFNQKTNVMYEAQACWQQETLSWKKSYEELERKYEHLLVQVKENSTVEKQNAKVQTTFTHRTKLSRKKKEGTCQVPQEQIPQEEAMETEQGNTSSSDAPASSGTPPQTTSDCEPSAASSRSNSTPAPDTQASSNKPTNLESKRQVFRATLNKVMQSKKNLSGTSEGGTASDASSGKTSLVGSTTPQAPGSQGELCKEQLGSSNGATALEAPQTVTEEDSGKDSPMDTSQSVSETADTPSEIQSVTTPNESMSTKGPNVAITASGTDIAASQKQETSSSKTTPFNTETSKLPSYSEAMSSQAIPSPSKPSNSTASPSKAQSETSEKTKVPSATHSTMLPESPKHPTGTASAKVPESSKDSSKKSGAETGKDSSGDKSTTPSQVQAEPEVIDLTDDPDPPTVTVSKPSAPSPHKKQDAVPVGKHTTLTTRSPHALVNLPSVPSTNAVVSRAAGVSTVSNSIAAPTPSGTMCVSANARQVKTGAPNPVLQNATQRSVQPVPQTKTGSTSGPTPSPKKTSPGVPQSISPQGNKQSTSAANLQLRNVNPPVVTTQMQGSNVRPQVVSLQHGQRQQIPAAGRGRPPTSQVTVSQTLVQQRPMPTSQHAASVTLAGLQPVMASMQNQARMQGQVAIQQRLQQQQQQISLHMLQQGRHQLPGAAASAAALATRQPQPWLQQPRPQLQVTSTQQQSLQVCQQIQLPTSQIQVQMVRPHGASAPPTLTTSTLQSGTQMTLQKQQQQQLQIQAQERAHAANHAQAVAKAAREQREQEQHQQARMTAQRLQSSQLEQQQAQRAQIKKLQEEQSLVQTKAQQHQNKKRLIVSQIQRGEEYQRTLKSKLSKHSGMSRQVYLSCQKQLQDVQEQERKLHSELSLVEKSIEECRQKSNQLDQHLCLATGATSSRLSPQELQKHQLQQQQQQLSQQLAQRQIQQQRNQQLQHQQQQQQVQKQQDTAKTKHPAQLPDLTAVLDVSRATLFTPMPIKPVLEIKHSQEGIVLSWKADPDGGASKVDVKRYLLYAYQESESSTPSTDLWKKIGAVDALPLPMACTLTHFKAGSMYHFAVCAISKHGRPGAFSNIGSINLP